MEKEKTSFFLQCFQKASYSGLLKVVIVWKVEELIRPI